MAATTLLGRTLRDPGIGAEEAGLSEVSWGGEAGEA